MLQSSSRPNGDAARAVRVAGHPMKGTHMSKNTISAIVPNATSVSMANFYEGALVAAGIDPSSLTFAQIVDVTRQLHPHWQADPARKAEREAAKAAKEAEAQAAREARESAKLARLQERKAKLAAELAKLGATAE